MSGISAEERLALKTPEASFVHVLQSEFNLSPREAQEVVSTASEMLGLDRPSDQIRPGQVRLVVASLKAPFGPPLSETDRVEITLTVDAGGTGHGGAGPAGAGECAPWAHPAHAGRKTLKVQEDLQGRPKDPTPRQGTQSKTSRVSENP